MRLVLFQQYFVDDHESQFILFLYKKSQFVRVIELDFVCCIAGSGFSNLKLSHRELLAVTVHNIVLDNIISSVL